MDFTKEKREYLFWYKQCHSCNVIRLVKYSGVEWIEEDLKILLNCNL